MDGENIVINYKSASSDPNNCPTIADTLINDGSELILAIATPSALAIKQKTSTIPVLITAVTDPADSDIVADNNVPGGNITGTSDLNPVAKQIELLTQILPEAKTVAVLYCSSEPNSKIQYDLAKAAIESQGLTCVEKTVSGIDEAPLAITSLKGTADAIYIPTDNTLADGMNAVTQAANSVQLPTIVGEKGMVMDGGLASYSLDYYELGKQTAQMAVEILNGADPSTMAIQYLDEAKLELVVNTETAAACGITIPESVLSQATVLSEK